MQSTGSDWVAPRTGADPFAVHDPGHHLCKQPELIFPVGLTLGETWNLDVLCTCASFP